MLGMPGSALSDGCLSAADIPHVEQMVDDSLKSCCIFKRQAPVPEAAPQTPFPQQNAADDPLQDLDTGEQQGSVLRGCCRTYVDLGLRPFFTAVQPCLCCSQQV